MCYDDVMLYNILVCFFFLGVSFISVLLILPLLTVMNSIATNSLSYQDSPVKIYISLLVNLGPRINDLICLKPPL